MTAIASVNTHAATQTSKASQVYDPDHDGDNDAGKSAAAEASEGNKFGPATNVSLSSAALNVLQNG